MKDYVLTGEQRDQLISFLSNHAKTDTLALQQSVRMFIDKLLKLPEVLSKESAE